MAEIGPARTISGLLRQAAQRLTASQTPILDARLLLMAATGLDEAGLIHDAEKVLPERVCAAFEEMIIRRARHEPIAYIVGCKDFWKARFRVTHDVLIPRPDSETLIETALALRPPTQGKIGRILDLGTGSGCLLASLLQEYPSARGIGIDRSLGAARLARENLLALSLRNRSQVICSDWASAVVGPFDIIVTNPPYIAGRNYDSLQPEIRDYEPRSALISDDQGRSDYRIILEQSRQLVHGNGLILIEIGDGQAEFLKMEASAYFDNGTIIIQNDLKGCARALAIDLK